MGTTIRSSRRAVRIFIPALATVLLLGVGEVAQAACYDAGQQLPVQAVSRFINEPGKLLTQFPNGGPQMISLVRDLVASDPGTLPLITELNTRANDDQVQAIGTGLGQAALVCARPAKAFSDEIQRVTIAANNKPMTQAFGAVMGDQFLGLAGPALGGGGAGATGQIGSTGGTAAGSAPLGLTTSVSTTTTTNATTSFGMTPSAAGGGGSENLASSAPTGSLASSALAGSPGSSAVAQTPGGTVFAANRAGSIFGASSNSSGPSSILGGSSTASVTTNVTANVNSPVSVSPSRPR
jgi:hypothetical protein